MFSALGVACPTMTARYTQCPVPSLTFRLHLPISCLVTVSESVSLGSLGCGFLSPRSGSRAGFGGSFGCCSGSAAGQRLGGCLGCSGWCHLGCNEPWLRQSVNTVLPCLTVCPQCLGCSLIHVCGPCCPRHGCGGRSG